MRLSILLVFLPSLASSQPFDGYVPPGTIHLSGNLFIDETEVANMHWLEFEFYARRDSLPKYHEFVIPNSEVTKNYRTDYYRNTAYRYYPVVGISQEQAMEYCRWRTTMVNFILKEKHDHNAISNKLKVRYRLPTAQEWELATSLIDTSKMVSPSYYRIEELLRTRNESALKAMLQNDTLSLRRVKVLLKEHKKNDLIPAYKLDYEWPVFSLLEDRLPANIYFPEWDETFHFTQQLHKPLNLIGNVAELVKEPGVVKGGSWRHHLAVSFPSKSIPINPEKVHDWVGFRCICEVWEIR